MRYHAKIDDNQPAIVGHLRALGFSVQSLAALGNGAPDLLVGRNGRNILLEVKDGSKPPSKQKLTPAEERWHQGWRGQVATVTDEKQAYEVCWELLRG